MKTIKKPLKLLFNTFLSIIFLAVVGCSNGHKCTYDQKIVEDIYLKSAATCSLEAQYYYSCICGKSGEETFSDGLTLSHDFSAKIAEPKYLAKAANCQEVAQYYRSCAVCGKAYHKTFEYGDLGNCTYVLEVPDWKYLKTEATKDARAVFYKSCVCGAQGEETFEYGSKLQEFTEEQKVDYTPTSLTVTLYEPENNIYGFTYNTMKEPLRPVIQMQKENGEWLEFSGSVEMASSYTHPEDQLFDYYVVKVEAQLEKNTEYTYRAYDKYVDVGTEYTSLETGDPTSDVFTFSHVSDTQRGPVEFGRALACMHGNTDFLVHTGDLVEYARYEFQFTEMLHNNFKYVSTLPIMAISGNHETTYRNGFSETYEHFHYKLPKQESVVQGLFYSFVYGNTKFIMLNSNDLTVRGEFKEEQYDWIVNELENNTATWTVVALHHPFYSVGKWGNNAVFQKQLHGIFMQYGVDLVLQGHDHVISRTYPIDGKGEPQTENYEIRNDVKYSINPNGVIYLMNGVGGIDVREPVTSNKEFYLYTQGSNCSSWADFEVNGNEMKVTVKYYDEASSQIKVYQTWGIEKTVS